MWMPGQMPGHAETLKSIGLEFDPAELSDPTRFPLNAIVSLGGCTASFVSPDGLLVTNHHCVTGALQHNSTPESNLLENGYLAKDHSEERWAGPGSRVYVTTSFADVTDKVYAGTDKIEDDKARYEKIAQNRKELVNQCESAKENVSCRVASFFEGAQYYQIEQLEIKDVRLVYAPHAGVGVYGGEIDNWRWPRHTGDFSFLRAYVSKDGKSAEFSKDNVPFKPSSHLKVAQKPLAPDDFVMVAGYPGRTSRLKTADEVRSAAEWSYPRSIARFEEYLKVLEELAKDPELAIKTASFRRGLNNALTNYKGMRDGLVKGGLADQKGAEEAELKKWIDSDEARKKKYGEVLNKIATLNEEDRKNRDSDAASGEIMWASTLLDRAFMVLDMAEERAKPDAERKAGFQERDWPQLKRSLQGSSHRYSRKVDRAMFELVLQRAAKLPEDKRPEALKVIVGEKVDDAAITKALDKLYAKTDLEKNDKVEKLLDTATSKKLKRNRDPWIKLALALKPIADASEERGKKWSGAMATLRPLYIEALRAFKGGDIAPDANSTLRITYGTVRGYQPEGKDEPYYPFTKITEMVAKHTGEDPFIIPGPVQKAIEAKKFGPYVDETMGEVPIDFLADLDITGGNSGSPTLNARGELVGLAFDGNYEAMASDWIFMPKITRSIHVDARYMLWIMDAVDGADHLVKEMGVTPAVD